MIYIYCLYMDKYFEMNFKSELAFRAWYEPKKEYIQIIVKRG